MEREFLHYIGCYLFSGVLWTFWLEWMSSKSEKQESLRNRDRLLGILIWPITLFAFIKEVYNKMQ